MVDRFVFRQRGPVLLTFLALNGTSIAAMVLWLVGCPNGRTGIPVGLPKDGFTKVLRGCHAALRHQVDQGRSPVTSDSQIAKDHRRSLEQAQHVLAGLRKALRIGDLDLHISVHHQGLQLLRPHHRSEPPAANRIPLAHHDVGEEHPGLSGRADGGDAASLMEGPHCLADAQSPELVRRL